MFLMRCFVFFLSGRGADSWSRKELNAVLVFADELYQQLAMELLAKNKLSNTGHMYIEQLSKQISAYGRSVAFKLESYDFGLLGLKSNLVKNLKEMLNSDRKLVLFLASGRFLGIAVFGKWKLLFNSHSSQPDGSPTLSGGHACFSKFLTIEELGEALHRAVGVPQSFEGCIQYELNELVFTEQTPAIEDPSDAEMPPEIEPPSEFELLKAKVETLELHVHVGMIQGEFKYYVSLWGPILSSYLIRARFQEPR